MHVCMYAVLVESARAPNQSHIQNILQIARVTG